jgi:hypothetical protein
MVKDLGHLVYFKKVPMPSSSMASGSGKYGGPPSTKGMFNQQSVPLGLLKANTSRTLKQLRCKASPCSVKKDSKTNPGKLFKWGFFKRKGHLVYRFAI